MIALCFTFIGIIIGMLAMCTIAAVAKARAGRDDYF